MPFETATVQFAIIACIVAYTVIYLIGIKREKIKPILATWLFFCLATTLSFVTNFFESGITGIMVNTFNVADMIAVLTITSVILFRKDIRKTFTQFEKICFVGGGVIFLGWAVSGQNILAHLCIQALMVIAYLPTMVHLWYARKNTESLSMWFFDFLGSVFGLIEPIRTLSLLPLVYTIRSTISTFIVMLLVLRLKKKGL